MATNGRVNRCCGCPGFFKRHLPDSHNEIHSAALVKGTIAEFLGTLILVTIGCGTCLAKDWEKDTPTTVQISLAFGLAVAAVGWCFGHVDAGHANPAVTTALFVSRKISLVRWIFYVFMQCAGAILGADILLKLTPSSVNGTELGSPSINVANTAFQGFVVEAFITFVLVLTIFTCCDKNRKELHCIRPIAIGLCVTMCHLFALKYTGSSMNPARALGPHVVAREFDPNHWVYWVGPMVGGVLAGCIHEL
ncbi:hypothetical protein HELRODRAFT_154942, partial [Helobdella robusta]|uniref:Aquaporin n=1 Tax=Helobdella robusta TaxID=6412 RepID=T1ELG5_HELRO